MKAERPDALPVQGGTDVLVALNFDRVRPEAILNLNEVAELRGFARENGSLRLGSGLTYAEAMREPLADALPALAEASRTVGSPQIRNRGTIGGNLGTASPGRRRAAAALRRGRRDRGRERPRRAPPRAGRVPARAEAERPRRGRADPRRPRQAERPAADVHEGRSSKRDGDRRLLAGARRRPRAGRDSRVLRLGVACDAARHRAARRRGRVSRCRRGCCVSDRRRARDRRLPPPCAYGAYAAGTRKVSRVRRVSGSEPQSRERSR